MACKLVKGSNTKWVSMSPGKCLQWSFPSQCSGIWISALHVSVIPSVFRLHPWTIFCVICPMKAFLSKASALRSLPTLQFHFGLIVKLQISAQMESIKQWATERHQADCWTRYMWKGISPSHVTDYSNKLCDSHLFYTQCIETNIIRESKMSVE